MTNVNNIERLGGGLTLSLILKSRFLMSTVMSLTYGLASFVFLTSPRYSVLVAVTVKIGFVGYEHGRKLIPGDYLKKLIIVEK